MDAKKDTWKLPVSGTTLRRPVQVVKKRSGPLDDALNELYQEINAAQAPSVAQPDFSVWQPTATDTSLKLPSFAVTAATPQPTRRRPTIKEKEKKRERWLLTRKTWKYMADAGRKLIPEGAQNRKEDIPKIEANFQHICANEPRFILWRRKSSYPGAVRNSKRRLKHLLQHTGQKGPMTLEALEQEEAYNADRVIDLLQSYLKLDDVCKTTTLLSSKTVRPDQTASPSARRPRVLSTINSGSGSGFFTQQLPKDLQQLNEIDQLVERLRRLSRSAGLNAFAIPPQEITPAILEDKVLLKQIYNTLKKQQLHRVLSTHSTPLLKGARPHMRHASSMCSLLHFGAGISGAKFGGSSKGQDLSLAPTNQDQLSFSTQCDGPPTTIRNNTVTPNITNAITTGAVPKKPLRHVAKDPGASPVPPSPAPRQRKPPNTLNLAALNKDRTSNRASRRVRQPQVVKSFNSCGTQTNFIPLQEIKRLAEEYKDLKRDEAALSCTPGATDDETEKGTSTPASTGSQHQHCRKSSIDNEDVSQSVSDTIKRYLRMARKKSVNDDNANRFKRVNYDRNLRNIKAKGEINPPGMDEDNSKAAQTLDAWPVICLDFIRGNETSGILETAHAEWQRALNERIQKKLEYDQKISGASDLSAETLAPVLSSCGSSSAPTSPTSPENFAGDSQNFGNRQTHHGFGSSVGGLRQAGSQFLSNLWHGTSNSVTATPEDEDAGNISGGSSFLIFHRSSKHDQNPRTIDSATKDASLSAAMQKSKSSSNVGQFVTRKILKSRSKSQSRPNTHAAIPKWAPAEKYTWTSDNGDRLLIQDSCLQNLTDIEAKILKRVAIEKISELNIGVDVSLNQESKPQKRRVLAKKKAMTTSFFDISKKEDQSGHGIFGNTLECCVNNDKKRGSNLKASSDRGSRNSIAALFRGGGGNDSTNKLHENVRSYESLPSSTFSLATPQTSDNNSHNGGAGSTKSGSGYFSSLSKSTSVQMQMSRSQSDVRRHSQDLDLHDPAYFKEHSELANITLQVPTFITSCIKYLEEHGLHKVGLFRVSTSKKRVKQMREEFDKNIVTDIRNETCPHDVATLLKEFLRDLPEPLLCSGLYKAFLETQRIRNRRLQLEAISHLVKLLPVAHRDTLYILLKFLARVASCSDDITGHGGNVQVCGNKMDSNNLATVFAPNILRTNLTNLSSSDVVTCGNSIEQESMNDAINIIRIMIDHYEEIFKVPAELIDIVYSHMLDVCPENLYSICEQRIQSVRDDIGNSCSSLNSTEQSLWPMTTTPASNISSSNVSSGVGVSPSTTTKRLYTRESVMHDNDACRVTEAAINGSNGGKRSMHSSRHSMTQKLRHDSRKSNASNSDIVDRRQSSPNIFDKSGIVSASLQIQVPVGHAGHLKLAGNTTPKKPISMSDEQTAYDLDEVFYKSGTSPDVSKSTSSHSVDHFDYTDIPYFEDAINTQELENVHQYIPIAGSLSISTKIEGSAKDYRQVQIVQQQQQQQI
uniref:Rho GTPase-activating protein 6 n=1 Tax=Zeugodacus cucurbitae TaxID=28588 RepID=A0A0A1XK29_ZEUCU